jgi:Cu/Ag efflux protein CusF
MKLSKKAVLAGVLATAMLFAFGRFAQAQENKKAGEPAAIMVDTVKASATVEAIDAPSRSVTLKMQDGKTKVLRCGPAVKNFDQIKAGDKVNFTFVDSVAAFVRKADAPPSADETAMVALAPKGAKPGALMSNTWALTVKIEAVDLKKHTVTLLNPDGSTVTIKAGKDIKGLNELKKGDDVVMRFTEAMLIDVVAPKK